MALRLSPLVIQTHRSLFFSIPTGNPTFPVSRQLLPSNNSILRCRNSSWMQPNVKRGEAREKHSTEEPIFDEQILQRELEKAVHDEDYIRAAKLRDDLRVLHEDGVASVLSANARFYDAFRSGDLASMQAIWSRGDHVYVVHPGAGRISGHELVVDSWEIICCADREFPIMIDLKNVEARVSGGLGYVTCLEVVKAGGGRWGKQVATNVFERVDGRWFMCAHHASHVEE
ncbi:hypothetical protein KSP39_PZI017426 [Platanthera zijinensis]|uniref:SnoaL-like domain-containing protein n=1 Tax=Platanthera zijinensis TaxID=2320716 RepID=A0AAP0B5F6_9ASPA